MSKDKMPDEWERAYAEAYPDRVPPYVQKAARKKRQPSGSIGLVTALHLLDALSAAEKEAMAWKVLDVLTTERAEVAALEAEVERLRGALEYWQRAHETGRTEPCYAAYEHARKALGDQT